MKKLVLILTAMFLCVQVGIAAHAVAVAPHTIVTLTGDGQRLLVSELSNGAEITGYVPLFVAKNSKEFKEMIESSSNAKLFMVGDESLVVREESKPIAPVFATLFSPVFATLGHKQYLIGFTGKSKQSFIPLTEVMIKTLREGLPKAEADKVIMVRHTVSKHAIKLGKGAKRNK